MATILGYPTREAQPNRLIEKFQIFLVSLRQDGIPEAWRDDQTNVLALSVAPFRADRPSPPVVGQEVGNETVVAVNKLLAEVSADLRLTT